MAPASKEGVTVADKEYLLGNKARELLKYTNQATKTVAEDISRKDVRQIFQKIAALDDIRDVQKVCSESIAYLDRTHREGFTKALYRCYGEDMRLIAKSIVRDIHAANGKMFQTEYEERLRLLGVVLDECSWLNENIQLVLNDGVISISKSAVWTRKVQDVKNMVLSWKQKDTARAEKLREQARQAELKQQAAMVKAIVRELLKEKEKSRYPAGSPLDIGCDSNRPPTGGSALRTATTSTTPCTSTPMATGTTTTAPCIAVAGKTASDNVFQITPSASSPSVLSSGNGNVFQVCFTDPNQGVASAQYIAENKLATKIGIIYDSSDVYSSGIEEKFEAEAKTQGLNIVSKAAFTADSKTDFGTQLQKAKDAGADLLFLPIYYQEASIILKQADTMGYKPKFFGVDGMDGILTVENFDTKLAEDVMLLTPFAADAKDKTVQNFVKTYKEKYKDTPNQFAADSYDAVYALKAAIEESKATTDMSASDMCDALKGAMTKIKMQGLTGGKDGLTWNESGEVTKSPKAVIIKNGAYKAM